MVAAVGDGAAAARAGPGGARGELREGSCQESRQQREPPVGAAPGVSPRALAKH